MFHRQFVRSKSAGFSLVELMIVVAIIGILAALAVPRFQAFQAKARAAEADTALASAYTLQVSYHGDNDTYGTLEQVGFQLNGQTSSGNTLTASPANKVRFGYTSAPAQNSFVVTATAAAGILGQCQTAAYSVTVNESKTIARGTIGC